MRIAVLNRTFSTTGGGAESYSVQLTRELAQRHEVHVFAQSTDQPVAGVTYHRVPHISDKPRWLNQLLYAVASWWATRQGFMVMSHENTWHGQVQVVHVRPTRLNLFDGRKGWRLALRWLKVITSPRLLAYLWLEGARFKPGKTVVATSQALADACQRAYPGVRVEVITPGVRMPFTNPLAESPIKVAARAQLGLPQDAPLVLFVANDYARKGLDTLLAALQRLRLHSGTDVRLAVVGSRSQQATYQALAEQLGLHDVVHFLGPLTDVSPAYQAADVLAHPTLEDSYAMVVLEAMAHGLPVVVSGPEYCGISAELVHGRQALLLDDPKDAAALAQHIQALLSEPKTRLLLAQQGQDWAGERSWIRVGQAFEVLL